MYLYNNDYFMLVTISQHNNNNNNEMRIEYTRDMTRFRDLSLIYFGIKKPFIR